MKRFFRMGILLLPALVYAVRTPEGDVTVSSDEMELQDSGARTLFTGHVVVEQPPSYELKAARMVQEKASGIIEARGRVTGNWHPASGEKLVAKGEEGRYNPKQNTTELWGHPQLTHWQTATDTAPVNATAGYFVYDQASDTLRASKNVRIDQGLDLWTRSDEAIFDRKPGVVHLWGQNRTVVHWKGAKAEAHFLCDRALVYLSPKHVRLLDNVKGHVTPSPPPGPISSKDQGLRGQKRTPALS